MEQLVGVAEGDVVRFAPFLREGQTIRVAAGPFVDLMGKLERLDDAGRGRVLLEIMGGQIPVLLPMSFVTPAQE